MEYDPLFYPVSSSRSSSPSTSCSRPYDRPRQSGSSFWKGCTWLTGRDGLLQALPGSGPRSSRSPSGWASCLGIVMSYQFGTNWSRSRSDVAGNVMGPLMSYEVLTAFFLEAAFLGIMLFGPNGSAPRLHFFAACMVALGTLISSFWILSANSWMQTPAGFEIGGRAVHVADGGRSSSTRPFPFRFMHMVTGDIPGDSALWSPASARWYLLQRRAFAERGECLLDGDLADLGPGAAADPARRPARAQHARPPADEVAAMEGHWETRARHAADAVRACPTWKPRRTITRSRIPCSAA